MKTTTNPPKTPRAAGDAAHTPTLPLTCKCSHFVSQGHNKPEAHHVVICGAANAVLFNSVEKHFAALIVERVNGWDALRAALETCSIVLAGGACDWVQHLPNEMQPDAARCIEDAICEAETALAKGAA